MIKIIAVGKLKEKSYHDLILEFNKQIKLSIIEVKDESTKNGIDIEGKRILSKIKNEIVISLEIDGNQYSTEQFETLTSSLIDSGNDLIFVIGGSYGLSEEVKLRAKYKISLSKMTFTHALARLLLVEQIYRVLMIRKGHPYHK